MKTYRIVNTMLANGSTKNDYFEVEVDPPLTFIEPGTDVPGRNGLKVSGATVAVCVCDLGDSMVRTVIHRAERLQGSVGISYGNFGALVLDGVPTVQYAMELLGYQEQVLDCEPEEPSSLLGCIWHVWPEGSTHDWIPTTDEKFARAVHAKNPDHVIEYKRQPCSF